MSQALHVNVKGDARMPLMDVSGAFTPPSSSHHVGGARSRPEIPARADPRIARPRTDATAVDLRFCVSFSRQRPDGER